MPIPQLVKPSGIFWAARVHKTVLLSSAPVLSATASGVSSDATVELSSAPVLVVSGTPKSVAHVTLECVPELGVHLFAGYSAEVDLDSTPILEVDGHTGFPYTLPFQLEPV